MENEKSRKFTKKEGEATNGNSLPETPTLDNVKRWVKADLQAAHYFLGLLLRYPDAIEKAAEEIYKDVKLKEAGAAIDHVNQEENAAG